LRWKAGIFDRGDEQVFDIVNYNNPSKDATPDERLGKTYFVWVEKKAHLKIA